MAPCAGPTLHAMLRWFLVVFLALMLINGLTPLLRRWGFGRLPGDLRFLPGGEALVNRADLLLQLGLEPGDLFGQIHAVRSAEVAQAFDLAFQFVNRLLEIKVLEFGIR